MLNRRSLTLCYETVKLRPAATLLTASLSSISTSATSPAAFNQHSSCINPLLAYNPIKKRIDILPSSTRDCKTLHTSALSLMASNETVKHQVAEAGSAVNPIDGYRQHVAELLAPIAGVSVEDIIPRLQTTITQDKGDLMLAVPSLRIKGEPPGELATAWAEHFPPSDLVEKPTVSATFLQFFFKAQPLTKKVVTAVLKEKEAFGSNYTLGLKDPANPSAGRKRIIVEFSSPNIAKPFHAGHLRSTIIGGFIANLYECAGWEVIRMNYLGDWGRQYGLLANAFELYGDEAKLKADPISHLYDIYVEINKVSGPEEVLIKEKKEELKLGKEAKEDTSDLEKGIDELEAKSTNEKARQSFKRLEDGDPQALATWTRFRDLSIDRYKKTYARLNINYDQYSGESQVEKRRMDDAAKQLRESGVSEESEGAVMIDLTKDPKTKKLGKALVQKKDGSSLYLTRDIGEAVKRYELYHFDKMIYVVASQQDLHLAQLFKILELMGHKEIAEKCQHINFGMVLGMSTRRGTVKFLDDILRDAADRMHAVMKGETEEQKDKQSPKDLQRINEKYSALDDPEGTADILGISAVMIQDMTGKRINNYAFDLKRMTSFEGDTGPYLQYAHARLCSITRKAQVSPEDIEKADLSLLKEPHAINLVRALATWPEVVQMTLKTLEPITILSYLFKMTHMLSSSYDVLQVVGSEPELKVARMALYEVARQVLNNGMRLLGLSPLQRM